MVLFKPGCQQPVWLVLKGEKGECGCVRAPGAHEEGENRDHVPLVHPNSPYPSPLLTPAKQPGVPSVLTVFNLI